MPDDDVGKLKTSWPVVWYLLALVFAFLSMAFLTVALDGRVMGMARSQAQLAACVVLGLRLVVAVCRREQGRGWIGYIVAMVFAVPIWLIVEPLILSLGR